MATKAVTKAAPLSDREKRILVDLRQNGVDSKLLSRTFGVPTTSIAAYVANATRGAGIFARA
jgi:hypothetical protein